MNNGHLSARVWESVYDSCDDYDAAVALVNRLNQTDREATYGVVETRTFEREIRTAARYLILKRRSS